MLKQIGLKWLFSDFEAGGCLESWENDELPEMGFYSTQWADKLPEEKHNNLVLRTGKVKPFCLHSYSGRLSIRQSDRRIHVDVYVKLNGEFGKTSEIKLNDEELYPHDGDVFRLPFDVSSPSGKSESIYFLRLMNMLVGSKQSKSLSKAQI